MSLKCGLPGQGDPSNSINTIALIVGALSGSIGALAIGFFFARHIYRKQKVRVGSHAHDSDQRVCL